MPYSNDEWLRKGSNTYAGYDPRYNEESWQNKEFYDNNGQTHYGSGQTYNQGTYEDNWYGDGFGAGRGYTVYDGGQNSRGVIVGDGSMWIGDGTPNGYRRVTESDAEYGQMKAAYDQMVARGQLDGTTTFDDYLANVEAGRQARKDAYEADQAQKMADYREWRNARWEEQRAREEAIRQMYDAQIQGVQNAQDKSRLDYQNAKNQTAGNAAIDEMSMAERFNALGLNSGTQGQMYLSQNNQKQANLTSLNESEAEAMADFEQQKAALKAQYQQAVADAIKEGNEKEAQEFLDRYNAQIDLIQQQQSAWDAQRQSASETASFAQSQVDAILEAGGTPSQALLDAAGYDPSYISTMTGYYAAKNGGTAKSGDGQYVYTGLDDPEGDGDGGPEPVIDEATGVNEREAMQNRYNNTRLPPEATRPSFNQMRSILENYLYSGNYNAALVYLNKYADLYSPEEQAMFQQMLGL